MAGEQDSLRKALERVQAQLADVRQLDPAVAQHLEATIAEAMLVLTGKSTQAAPGHSLRERLSEAVLKYEAEHPNLALSLGAIIDALGQLGI